MRNKGWWWSLLLTVLVSQESCNWVRPFFIHNTRKQERKEKRTEKKEEKKESRHAKKKNKPKPADSTSVVKASKPPLDTLVVKKEVPVIKGPDTAYAQALLQARRMQYHTYLCKAKMHFESEQDKQNFVVNFRLKKDSIIWASISAPIIGEVVRAVITPDSVKAIERMNKKSYLYSYADIQKLINIEVDFNTLQELILGNPIATDGTLTDLKELGSLSNLFIRGKDYTNQLSYQRSDSTLRQIQLQTARPTSSSSMMISMNQYALVDLRYLPILRQYHILDLKGAVELDMEINRAEFDTDVDFPFAVPKNYKRQE